MDQSPRTRRSGEYGPVSFGDLGPPTQELVHSGQLDKMGTVHPVMTRNYDQSLSIIARIESGRLFNIAHFWKCAESPGQLSAAKVETDKLRFRANVTIPVGLDSATITMGVATRRERSSAAHLMPEMGDADQRRDDADIQMGFGVAIGINQRRPCNFNRSSSVVPRKPSEDVHKATGAPMALIKKIDVEKYFADRRAMRRGRIAPASQPVAARIEPTRRTAKAPVSVGNLTSEHSSASASSTSIPITTDSGRNHLLRPPGSRQK